MISLVWFTIGLAIASVVGCVAGIAILLIDDRACKRRVRAAICQAVEQRKESGAMPTREEVIREGNRLAREAKTRYDAENPHTCHDARCEAYKRKKHACHNLDCKLRGAR